MGKRIKYIDTAKGLLILMVVIGHIDNIAKNNGINNPVFEFVNYGDYLWGAFFMPAYFYITGMCSNFQKQFQPFLISQIKSILIPAFTLAFICYWIKNLTSDNIEFTKSMGLPIKTLFLNGSAYWFLSALFLSKVMLWFLLKYLSKRKIVSCLILSFVIGVFWSQNIPSINPWYIMHAFLLLPFMALGYYGIPQKINNKWLWGGVFYTIDSCMGFQPKSTKY